MPTSATSKATSGSAAIGRNNDGWKTPIEFYRWLDDIFRFEKRVESDISDVDRLQWPDAPVFVNPPHSQLARGNWIETICVKTGAKGRSCALLPGRIETEWFEKVFRTAQAILVLRGRLVYKFEGESFGMPVFPSIVAVFGKQVSEKEVARLSEKGAVLLLWENRLKTPEERQLQN